MNRISHSPLTLPKYPELLNEVNDFLRAVLLYHKIKPDGSNEEQLRRAKELTPEPTWLQVEELLCKVMTTLQHDRCDPVKR